MHVLILAYSTLFCFALFYIIYLGCSSISFSQVCHIFFKIVKVAHNFQPDLDDGTSYVLAKRVIIDLKGMSTQTECHTNVIWQNRKSLQCYLTCCYHCCEQARCLLREFGCVLGMLNALRLEIASWNALRKMISKRILLVLLSATLPLTKKHALWEPTGGSSIE